MQDDVDRVGTRDIMGYGFLGFYGRHGRSDGTSLPQYFPQFMLFGNNHCARIAAAQARGAIDSLAAGGKLWRESARVRRLAA